MRDKQWDQELIDAMGGEGEAMTPAQRERACHLWETFSINFDAQWLVVNAGTLGNFAAWLIGTVLPTPPQEGR
jgi:hypothetical protein